MLFPEDFQPGMMVVTRSEIEDPRLDKEHLKNLFRGFLIITITDYEAGRRREPMLKMLVITSEHGELKTLHAHKKSCRYETYTCSKVS